MNACPHLARSPDTRSHRDLESPLSTLLKTLTQPQHDEAEGHPLHTVLFGGEGPDAAREAYTRLLAQHLHIQESFEPRLRALAKTHPTLVRPHHFHLEALRHDLADLSVPPHASLPATARFVEFIRACEAHDGAALIGVFYVFEGSTNGGTIVGKRVNDLLGLSGGRGTHFINPHGPNVRPLWTAWRHTLDALNLGAAERELAIAGAQEAFRLSREVLDDVHRTMLAGTPA